MEEKTKICKRCGIEKPVSEFHKTSRNKDGLNDWCKDCACEYQRIQFAKKQAKKRLEKEITLYGNPELAKFQPRELIKELQARGYSGELRFVQKIQL